MKKKALKTYFNDTINIIVIFIFLQNIINFNNKN